MYNFLETSTLYKPAVQNPAHRSQTVVVADVAEAPAKMASLKAHGLVIGSGYGLHKEAQVRIANFPATTSAHIDQLIRLL